MDDRRKMISRRRALRSLLAGAVAVGLAWLGALPVLRRWVRRLRPPGALPERQFLASCIKCGQCVQVCPVEAIRLADIGDGLGQGVPYIDPRRQACDFSCDVLQCILACPTGALSHRTETKEQARVGVARLVRPDACLARRAEGLHGPTREAGFAGRLRYAEQDRWRPLPVREQNYDLAVCDLCVRHCPIEGAISMEPWAEAAQPGARSPVIHASCVGCGVCSMVCPSEPACIEVADEGRFV